MLIPPSVLIITPFRQILKGVIPKIVSRDRKIFAVFFVHFVKNAHSLLCTRQPPQIVDSGLFDDYFTISRYRLFRPQNYRYPDFVDFFHRDSGPARLAFSESCTFFAAGAKISVAFLYRIV